MAKKTLALTMSKKGREDLARLVRLAEEHIVQPEDIIQILALFCELRKLCGGWQLVHDLVAAAHQLPCATGSDATLAAHLDVPPIAPDLQAKLDQPIASLAWSVRVRNILENADIRYVGDLVQKGKWEMRKRRGFGEGSVREVEETLAELGLSLGMQIPGWQRPKSP